MRKRKWGLAALLLAISLMFSAPTPAHGAGLSGGSYTYLVNGEEVAFPFDPIVVQDQLLLPAAVFERLGVSVSDTGAGITLRLADRVEARLTLGSPTYSLSSSGGLSSSPGGLSSSPGGPSSSPGGRPQQAPAVPVRLGGHLFLPAALLEHFGVELTRAGSLLLLRQPLKGALPTTSLTEDEYLRLKAERSFKRELISRQSGSLQAEFTLLDPALLAAPQLGLSYGHRVKLLGLLETHTLVLVKLSNQWSDPASFRPHSVVLLDDLRHQGDLAEALPAGEGDLTAPLAPGADRRGVLAFPKADPSASRLLLYYHETRESLGAFTLKR